VADTGALACSVWRDPARAIPNRDEESIDGTVPPARDDQEIAGWHRLSPGLISIAASPGQKGLLR
jgi:hypothetical protein